MEGMVRLRAGAQSSSWLQKLGCGPLLPPTILCTADLAPRNLWLVGLNISVKGRAVSQLVLKEVEGNFHSSTLLSQKKNLISGSGQTIESIEKQYLKTNAVARR